MITWDEYIRSAKTEEEFKRRLEEYGQYKLAEAERREEIRLSQPSPMIDAILWMSDRAYRVCNATKTGWAAFVNQYAKTRK